MLAFWRVQDSRYKHLVGGKVVVPLSGREIPVIADDYVDMEFGTGALKITPGEFLSLRPPPPCTPPAPYTSYPFFLSVLSAKCSLWGNEPRKSIIYSIKHYLSF